MDDELLRKYFEFDEADLFANRSERLTSRQRARLLENARFTRKVFRIAGMVIIGIGVLPSLFLWLNGVARGVPALAFLIVWSVLWIPLWIFFGVRVIRLGETKKDNLTVHKAEGRVNIVKEESYNSSMKQTVHEYELHIGGKTFDVDSELADVMMQGDRYVIYYVGETEDILSAEKASDHE